MLYIVMYRNIHSVEAWPVSASENSPPSDEQALAAKPPDIAIDRQPGRTDTIQVFGPYPEWFHRDDPLKATPGKFREPGYGP